MQKSRGKIQVLLAVLVMVSLSLQFCVPLPVLAQADPKKMYEDNDKLIDDLSHKDNTSLYEKTKNANHIKDRFKDLDKQTEYMSTELSAGVYGNLMMRALSAGLLADEDFCRLYKSLRGPGGKFDKTKVSSETNRVLAGMDKVVDVRCKEKKAPECPKGLKTINDCIKDGATVDLIGDGTTTSHCTVELTNPKTGTQTTAEIHTVCMSKQTQHPPQPRDESKGGGRYSIGGPAPRDVVKIVKAARKLSEEGKFDSVPLPPERKSNTIMQLGIWRHLGGSNPKDKDAVTNQSVTNHLLARAHVSPKSLTTDEQQQLTNRVDQILTAVDLTEKTAETIDDGEQPKEKEEPKKPKKPKEPECTGKPEDDNKRTTENPKNSPNKPGNSPGISLQAAQPSPSTPAEYEGKVCIPEFTVFESQNKECQDMMTVEDAVIDCPDSDGGSATGGGIPGGSRQGGGTPGGLKNPQDEPIAESPCKYAGFKLFSKTKYDEKTDDVPTAEKREREDAISAEKHRLGSMGKGFFDEDQTIETPGDTSKSDMYIFFVCNDKAGAVIKAFKLSPEEAKNFEYSTDRAEEAKRKTARGNTINKYRDSSQRGSKY